jgi:hypothetical protein
MLPELWEKIFEELSGRELLQVFLVCKDFKGIIETSSRLMHKLNLNLTKSKSDGIILQSTRKYRNLTVDGVNENLKAFLCAQSNSIENLRIANCSITTSDVQQLLEPICHIIRELSLCNVKLRANKSEEVKGMNFVRLEKLRIMSCYDNTCLDALHLLQTAKLREFVYMSNHHARDEFESLMRFLISQEELTSFCLASNVAGRLMQSEEFTNEARFRLKTFWVEYDGDNHGNLLKFLVKHQQTLKQLSVENLQIASDFINSLSTFNQLSALRLSNCSFKPNQTYKVNKTVKELSLSPSNAASCEKEICSFLSSMQRAEKLNLSSFKITFDVALSVAYNMQCLIHLSLDKCDLNPFSFVNIKRLRFIDGKRIDVMQTTLVNRHVELLELSKDFRDDPDIRDVIDKLEMCKTVKFR